MTQKRPVALSIAGFDPSSGAGVTADLKTFEAHKVQGLGVCTAITFENDSEFDGLEWLPQEKLEAQLKPLFRKFRIRTVKIGLIRDLETLNWLVDYLLSKDPEMHIIWDPILKASAGFTFHENLERSKLENLCRKLFLITPNWPEMEQLAPGMPAEEGAQFFSKFCTVFLKGGHNELQKGRDFLFQEHKKQSFRPGKISKFSKHGSGCVLSAALTALLAKDYPLEKACLKAKKYVTQFLNSNPGLLGYHKI